MTIGIDAGGKSETPGRRFHEFIASKVSPIPGWLADEAALLTAHLVRAQRVLGISGPTLEIGVYKGKYLSVLYALSEPGEAVVGVDLFIGSEDVAATIDEVGNHIEAACGHRRQLTLLPLDSTKVSARQLRRDAGGQDFRFISIDGGHTREVLLSDLKLSRAVLKRGGIIAVDDVFNHTTPGVTEGLCKYFARLRPGLAPFAHCYNKLFVTTPDFHARYLEETVRFVEEVTWLPTHERTRQRTIGNRAAGFVPELFGFEIVAFL